MDADGPHYETDELRDYVRDHADGPLDWQKIDQMASDIQEHIRNNYIQAPVGSDGKRWHICDKTEDGQTVIGIGADSLFIGRYVKTTTLSDPVPMFANILSASGTAHFDSTPPYEHLRRIARKITAGGDCKDYVDALYDIAAEIERDGK